MTTTRPQHVSVLSFALVVFCGGYFISKGLMNVGFYSLTLGGMILLCFREHQRRVNSNVTYTPFTAMAAALVALAGLEYFAWKYSPYHFQLTRDMIRNELRLVLVFVSPFCLALVYSLSSEKVKNWLPKIVILGLLFLGVLGSLQWLFMALGLNEEPFRKPHIPRGSYGLQNMAIFFSYQIYPLIILVASWVIEKDGFLHFKNIDRRWRLLAVLAVGFALVSVLGSGNRAALMIVIAMVPFLLLRQKPKMLLPFVLVAGALGSIALFKTPAGKRLRQGTGDPGIQHRLLVWEAHYKTFRDRPFLGVGRQVNTKKMYLDTLDDKVFGLSSFTWYGAHSLYLDLLSSLGVFGLIFFLVYWWTLPLKVFWRTCRDGFFKGSQTAFVWGLFLAFGSWFVGGLTESSMDVAHARLLLPVLFSPFVLLANKRKNL